MTCESGHGFAKSIGYQTPSLRSASQELKSQPKNALIVSVVSRRSCASSAVTKSVSMRVAVVQRRVGVVLHEVRLRPEADAAHEPVVRIDRRLQVHDRLAALLVRLPQRGRRRRSCVTPLQPPPSYGFMNSG